MMGHETLSDCHGLVACGGFSYGDVLGAGEGGQKVSCSMTLSGSDSPISLSAVTPCIGVCNGCQMMSALQEIIPGSSHWPRFARNLSEQYEARLALVRVEASPSILLSGMEGSHLPIVVAHGEGRAQFADAARCEALESSGLVSLRFIENDLQVASTYPANPNGSPPVLPVYAMPMAG
ncbi:MAG: hypothetical protein CM15mP74_04060 [Halieaceae bacterium]|nr:MAG: hypothetical protein CM15mP74_04060 [Halieaceae bacterium]